MVFNIMELRKIFGPEWYKVTGEWRNLHNEQLNYLYCSPNIIRAKNERGRVCSTYGGEKNCIQGFVEKPKGRRPV
jgi:hypothetical protein